MSIKPHQWCVGFALPLTEAEYRHCAAGGDRFDFMRQVPGGWKTYRDGIVRPAREALNFYASLGVAIETGFTLSKFTGLDAQAFTLVAHWTDAGVELADGIVPFHEVARAVPKDYSGLIDLCLCHPAPLVESLRQERPSIRAIKFIDARASLLMWLRLYKALFALIAIENLEAEEALEGCVSAAIDAAKLGKGSKWAVRL